MSAGWTARRLLHKGWVELARLAEMSETGSRAASADMDHSVEHTASVMAVSANMLDRIALLTPRLAMNDPQHDQSAINALGDLRIGLTIARLRTLQTRLAQAGIDLYPLMQHLALYFRGRSAVARFGSVPGVAQDAIHTMPVLLTDIDGLLRAVCASAAGAQLHQAIVLLASLRQDLFPDAVSYDPLITSSGVSAVIPSAHTLAEES